MSLPPPQLPPPPPPRAQTRRRITRRPAGRRSRSTSPYPVTNALIAINVGIFVWELLMNIGARGFSQDLSEIQYRMVISQQFIDDGEWYRLLSAGFIHFGLFHVAMNMLLLYQLGRLLEPAVGSLTFGLVYFASLLGGSAGALVASPDALTGGASGAVFGLMAAGVVGLRQRGVNPMQTGLGLTFVINLLFTLAIPGVSIGGHFGGALAGALCGSVALAPARWRLPAWSANAAAVVVGLLAVVIAATPRL